MTNVTRLRVNEAARLDTDRLESLVLEYGEPGAERFLGRTLEDIAVRLNRVERSWRRKDMVRLCHGARELSGVAEMVGLTTLARAAENASSAAISGDLAAMASTMSRLSRIGEVSLISIWDQQDQSI
ncbi:MAG: hypothetical protein AAGA87_09400 [Pseudomonadota bacterium]